MAIVRLQRALDAIPALNQLRYGAPEFNKWIRDTEIAITNTFGDTTRHIEDFKRIRYVPAISLSGTPSHVFHQAYVARLGNASSILRSMIDEIEEYWEDGEEAATTSDIPQVNEPTDEKKVFIVHGRDQGTLNIVARFLGDLELESVILQEQPNQGLTIIQKFENYAQVGFAVVLFTPDDIGAVRSNSDTPQFRARQNVIFELGYLIRHLGRDRVSVLYKGDEGDIEIPSDYSGVLYIPLDDAEGWKMKLIREMTSAGLEIDANRAL